MPLRRSAFFRVDSSLEIGSGHLRRCLVLARELNKKNFSITFLCKSILGNLNHLVKESGFKLIEALDSSSEDLIADLMFEKEGVSLTVIDHYGIDEWVEKKFRNFSDILLVIDDLANRRHDCDILLDQNYFESSSKRYSKLVNEGVLQLFGPSYALLREEFQHARNALSRNSQRLNNIVITMGGTDPRNLTEKMLDVVLNVRNKTGQDWSIKVVSNRKNKKKSLPGVEYCFSPDKMSELFLWADICIGTSGSTNWERCCLGLPAVVVVDGSNEEEVATHAEKLGVLLVAKGEDVSSEIETALKSLDNKARYEMSKKALAVCDGDGAKRVVEDILKEMNKQCQMV